MMRKKHYSIPISPIAWQRAGLNGKRFYDNQSHDKISIGLVLRQQHNQEPLFKGPLRLDVVFYVKRPECKKKDTSPWHITTPDYDNFLKFLGDTLNKVIWDDDRYVCAGSWLCIYDDTPRTEFRISELSHDPITINWDNL